MAGDWIQMRVWLEKDPRLVAMADVLAVNRQFINWLTDPVRRTCERTAYEHVTPRVTRALCVTALLVTWGTAREQGRRSDDDLIVDFMDADSLSEITDLPGFGAAMVEVGWLIENEDGSATFPKFFRQKESPHARLSNAERQRRYRERNAGVTRRNGQSNASNVTDSNDTVTKNNGREEKRRVYTPIVPLADRSAQFDEFWKLYPARNGQKVGKHRTIEKFNRLDLSDVPLLLAATRRYASVTKDGFAKDPFRFLENNLWRDYVQNGQASDVPWVNRPYTPQ